MSLLNMNKPSRKQILFGPDVCLSLNSRTVYYDGKILNLTLFVVVMLWHNCGLCFLDYIYQIRRKLEFVLLWTMESFG